MIRDALKVFQSNSKPSTSGGNQKQEIQMSDSGSQFRRLHEGVSKRSHFVPAIRQPVSPEIVVRCQPLLPRSAKTSGTNPENRRRLKQKLRSQLLLARQSQRRPRSQSLPMAKAVAKQPQKHLPKQRMQRRGAGNPE